MAHEALMATLSSGMERAIPSGPFLIQDRRPEVEGIDGPWCVVVQTEFLVTCGSGDGKDRALELAGILNQAWDAYFETKKVK